MTINFILNSKWIRDSPERFKYIIANDRVNKKSYVNGMIYETENKEYHYYYTNQRDFEEKNIQVLTAKKVLFGYEISLLDNKNKRKKIGYLRKYTNKKTFIFFQENTDKIFIRYKEIIKDDVKFRGMSVNLNFEDNSILFKYKNRITDQIFSLVNRMPKFDPSKNIFTLKYDDKLVVPCYKNFQLVSPAMPDHLTLSLGRITDKKWTIAHSFPWNATQAFSIALSTILLN